MDQRLRKLRRELRQARQELDEEKELRKLDRQEFEKAKLDIADLKRKQGPNLP